MDAKIKYEMEKYADALQKRQKLQRALEQAIDEIFSHPSVKPPSAATPAISGVKDPSEGKHKHDHGHIHHDISSPYGERVHPVTGKVTMHKGIDLRGPEGTPVRAYDDGVVIKVSRDSVNGNYIIIQHSNGVTSSYAHLSQQNVSKDDRVYKGQQIGAVGKTGRVTGPHLHFGLKQRGQHVDPEPYIQDRRIVG